MSSLLTRAGARACDFVVPGAGMLLAGRPGVGAFAMAAWVATGAAVAGAVGFAGLDARRAILAAGVAHLSLGTLLLLTRLRREFRPHPVAAAAGIACVAAVVAVATWHAPFGLVTVADYGEFPALLPGEVVLVRLRDFATEPPARGDLVVARVEGTPRVARVAGLPRDRVGLAGPSLTVNDAVVPSTLQGEVRLAGGPWPAEETRSLQAYEESLGDRPHLFFFRRDVSLLPEDHLVPADAVFLLADNRSSADVPDSREAGPVRLAELIGVPGQVLWSPRPGGGTRVERIGTRWE